MCPGITTYRPNWLRWLAQMSGLFLLNASGDELVRIAASAQLQTASTNPGAVHLLLGAFACDDHNEFSLRQECRSQQQTLSRKRGAEQRTKEPAADAEGHEARPGLWRFLLRDSCNEAGHRVRSAQMSAKQSKQADDDKVDGDDVIEQSQHDKNQDASDQRYERAGAGNDGHDGSM